MTAAQHAAVEIFLKAFGTLSKAQRGLFLQELLRERAYREDLLDLATIETRRHEPGRLFRDYLAERSRRNKRR